MSCPVQGGLQLQVVVLVGSVGGMMGALKKERALHFCSAVVVHQQQGESSLKMVASSVIVTQSQTVKTAFTVSYFLLTGSRSYLVWQFHFEIIANIIIKGFT